MNVNTKKNVRRRLLREASEDEVGLWLVARWVQAASGSETALRKRTLDLVGAMLRDGLIQAGHPDPEQERFAAWPLTAREAVERMKKEWKALGRRPKLGEIAWFATTERGEQAARRSAMTEQRRSAITSGDRSSVGEGESKECRE